MPYKIVIDLPHLADGAELHVDGLGTFIKGGDNIVDDEAAEAFEIANIRNEPAFAYEYDEEGNPIKGTKSQVGLNQVRHDFVDLFDSLSGVRAELAMDLDPELETHANSDDSDTADNVEGNTLVESQGHIPDEQASIQAQAEANVSSNDGSGPGGDLTGSVTPEQPVNSLPEDQVKRNSIFGGRN